MSKKLLMLPVMAMLFFLMPAIAFWENAGAAEIDTGLIASGACGKVSYEEESEEIICEIDESVKYRLYADGTMLIFGNGEMGNFDTTAVDSDVVYRKRDLIPWYDYRSKIKKVVVKEGVTTIGDAAFYGCKNLESVYWADSIKKIGDNAFYGCKGLKSIPWTDNIEYVGSSAFEKCSSLEEVKLPSYVKEWGESVFAECKGLKKAYMDEDFRFDIWYVDEEWKEYVEGLLPIGCDGRKMFSGCTSLEELKLPKDTLAIPSYFVEGCISLKTFPIPDGVIYWGSCPPALCSGKYILPDSVQTIGNGGFAGCSDLEELILTEGVVYIGTAFEGCSNLKTLKIPKSVRELYKTFYNCSGLESIVIPDTVQKGLEYLNWELDGVFEGCSNLKSVVLPKDMKLIGSNLFKNCISLKKINLPPKLKEIGNCAFYGCSSLNDIKIPKTVKIIGMYSFSGCTSLKEIKLPSKLWWLGDSTFSGCTSLEEIDLPKGVDKFYKKLFYNCKNLKSVTIRAKEFDFSEEKIFYGCKNFSKITLYAEKVEISWSAKPLFEGIKKKITIYVPKDCVKKLKNQFNIAGVDMSKINIKPMQ